MLPSAQVREVTMQDYLKIIQKRFWVIFAFFFVLVGTVTVFTMRMIPIYRATTSILIERTPPKIVSIEEVYQSGIADKEYYQTQYKILTSRTLVKKTVDELRLGQDEEFQKAGDIVSAFIRKLFVEPVKESRLVNVSFNSYDPVKAAKIVNTFARLYIQQDLENKSSTSRQAVGWLEEQLVGIKKKLENAEGKLNSYIQENKIVSIPTMQEQSESLLETLKKDQARVETEIQESSKRYKERHPKMIGLYSELKSIKDKINIETNRLLSLNQKMGEYNILKREVESNKELYESLLKRAKETSVSEELQTSNIRIVDPAEVPKQPLGPNKPRNIISAAILGLLGGFCIAILLEYIDSTIKTSEDVELYVKLPFLGYVPSFKKEVSSDRSADLICYSQQATTIAEAFRSIRTSIIFSSPEDRPLKVILVTSTFPEEGKTTNSINLAIVFAQKNEQVVIVEGDMRKHRIAKSFDLDNKEGLSSYLTGTATLERVIKKTPIPNLYLIPSGPTPPNPAELLTSVKTKELFEGLKIKFDRIIVDAPPVMTVADASILANMCEGVVEIIRAGRINLDHVLHGKQRLLEAKAKILGVILNDVEVKKKDSYYYYHYYYRNEGNKEG
ncbi:MAG: polysaccharide biosynthesis tyrosine autokinase [Candidatus Omnitrophica bacterium]|nr:polysaccharide biosynthesis tyrosine autokinase [Candidatus Omnitrophota bacterium]MDD5652858.1 polysaccharide biosynthesis tyrosine autokinase [Candidatus Omnitrophota bacterium]